MLLSIQNLSKTYQNSLVALDGIDLDISTGMFGLLGPNGAGKSTLMRTIATLQLPDSGKIFFNGEDIFSNKIDFRKKLGYLPQEFGVYPKDTAAGLLNYFAILKGISSKSDRKKIIDQVLDLTNLQAVRKERVSRFSGGMRQRFGIAQLLLNQPQLIIVDEPTAGLDPAERTRFLNVLRNIGSENIVLFSTHLVEDVKELCRNMAILDKGQILSIDSPAKATEALQGKVWETTLSTVEPSNTKIPYIDLSTRFDEQDQRIHRVYSDQRPGTSFVSVDPKLEDYYFLKIKMAQQ